MSGAKSLAMVLICDAMVLCLDHGPDRLSQARQLSPPVGKAESDCDGGRRQVRLRPAFRVDLHKPCKAADPRHPLIPSIPSANGPVTKGPHRPGTAKEPND